MFGTLALIMKTQSVQGFSRKSQFLFLIVYLSRYLNIFQSGWYLFLFKAAYILITTCIIASFTLLHHTFDETADSCNVMAIVIPVVVFAFCVSEGQGVEKECWTFSEFLEPFALVPQYLMCYRKVPSIRPATVFFVLTVGGYRVFYVCNWLYKRHMLHGAYSDPVSWVGGAFECTLLLDFMYGITHQQGGVSSLGQMLLNLDDRAGNLSNTVELHSLGRRIPLGLSGTTQSSKSWDPKDQLCDEESSKLLTFDGDI